MMKVSYTKNQNTMAAESHNIRVLVFWNGGTFYCYQVYYKNQEQWQMGETGDTHIMLIEDSFVALEAEALRILRNFSLLKEVA